MKRKEVMDKIIAILDEHDVCCNSANKANFILAVLMDAGVCRSDCEQYSFYLDDDTDDLYLEEEFF